MRRDQMPNRLVPALLVPVLCIMLTGAALAASTAEVAGAKALSSAEAVISPEVRGAVNPATVRAQLRDQATLLLLASKAPSAELVQLLQSLAVDIPTVGDQVASLSRQWQALGFEPPATLALTGQTPCQPAADLDCAAWLQGRLFALEPDKDYPQLSAHLRHLLWLSGKPWQRLSLTVSLHPQDSSPLVPELRARLVALGDLSTDSGAVSEVYEGALVTAVQAFQRRHGLEQDGVVGQKTLKWLNLEPETRARILARGYLDKAKAQRQLPPSYVLVNIPGFSLELVDSGQSILRSRVIVGKASRQTPSLDGEISAVVVNPSWRVPRRLVTQDILPKVRRDGAYLSQKGFEIIDSEGTVLVESDDFYRELAGGRFPYRLEQRPGPQNALGRFKLHFANDDSIYLHDTPERHLYAKANRALSSGCVRVEKIAELAEWLSRYRVADPRRWQQAISEPDTTRWFALRQRMPVKFVYWTSWIDDEGRAQFRDDIYSLQ